MIAETADVFCVYIRAHIVHFIKVSKNIYIYLHKCYFERNTSGIREKVFSKPGKMIDQKNVSVFIEILRHVQINRVWMEDVYGKNSLYCTK